MLNEFFLYADPAVTENEIIRAAAMLAGFVFGYGYLKCAADEGIVDGIP